MNLDETTLAVPEGAHPQKLLSACEGYDQRIAKGLDHNCFYDKFVLPQDVVEEERRQSAVGTEESSSEVSWSDSDKADASKKDEATKDDVVLSPTKEAEK